MENKKTKILTAFRMPLFQGVKLIFLCPPKKSYKEGKLGRHWLLCHLVTLGLLPAVARPLSANCKIFHPPLSLYQTLIRFNSVFGASMNVFICCSYLFPTQVETISCNFLGGGDCACSESGPSC